MRGGGPRKLQVTVFGNHAIEPCGSDYDRHADLATKELHPDVASADIGKGTGGESVAIKNSTVVGQTDLIIRTAQNIFDCEVRQTPARDFRKLRHIACPLVAAPVTQMSLH